MHEQTTSPFQFIAEGESFATEIGHLCPERYSHEIEVGDTIEVGMTFMKQHIALGKVMRRLDELPGMEDLKAAAESGDVTDEQRELADKTFDFQGEDIFDYGTVCQPVLVTYTINVSKSFALKVTKDDDDLTQEGVLLTEKARTARLRKTPKGHYLLTGQLRGLVSSREVVSTQAMEDFKSHHAKNTRVENVACSQRIMSTDLVHALNAGLDLMCKNERSDYHPGSGKVVRDLVHPSLYCYVKGVSTVNAGGLLGDTRPESSVERKNQQGKDFWGREYEDSVYQWLPAEFTVSVEGKVDIASYINNLDRQKYPEMYNHLARLFETVLPMFEAVCSNLRNDFHGVDGVEKGHKVIPLRGRTLQVVTKIVEYRVNEEQDFDGVWHVEGMSHEEVMATGLCVIKRDENFGGAEIEFRRFLFDSEGDDLLMATPQNARRPTDTMGGGDIRPLGTLPTPANQVIVFPNSHIHRLSSMYSLDGKDAVRRIVVFWLVNPDRPIVSTANVQPQQVTISWDDALKNRLALMAERKLHKESYEEREVFLCEH